MPKQLEMGWIGVTLFDEGLRIFMKELSILLSIHFL